MARLIDADELRHYMVSSDDAVPADTLMGAWNTAIYKCMYDAPSYIQGRRGKWEHDGSKWTNRWVCSECNHLIYVDKTNFCPNCGAIMR